ncbi:MAG: metalloregulator ArsR/SmtB family transcription factor [Candidatus Limnocylindrales bacterium]
MPKRNGHGIDLLADPTRRGIVALIALGIGQPAKIAKEIGRSRPATSRQVRILFEAGLVSVRRGYADGRRVVYFIDPRRLGQITAWLAGTEVGRAFPPTPRDLGDPTDGSA